MRRAAPTAALALQEPAAPAPGGFVTETQEFVALTLDTAYRLVPRFALALGVLLVFVALSVLVRALLRRVFTRTHLGNDVADLLLSVARYVVIGFGAILALENLGFNVTSVIAGLGIAGIALGFAAKDTLANFIAGVTILWDRPFRVGDRIEVSDSLGIVRKITLRTTRLDTVRNEVVILPNQTMVTEKIVNHTMRPSLRVDVPFGIGYGEDMQEARRVVLATVEGDDAIRPKPEPAVVVSELGESSVNMELRFWLKDPRAEIQMRLRYVERVKAALDAAGIEIPFPQRTLTVGAKDRAAMAHVLGSAPGDGAELDSAREVERDDSAEEPDLPAEGDGGSAAERAAGRPGPA